MAADSKQLHPALQYLKGNVVVIGLVVIVAASVAFFAFTQNAHTTQPAAAATPTALATAVLDSNTPATAAPRPTQAPTDSPAPTASPTAGEASQGAPQPSPAPTATKRVVLGTGPQAVSASDWRPYAQKFSKAWANTAGGKDAWLGRLKPLVTADLYAGFTTTNISTIPVATFQSVSLAEESMAAKTFRAYSTGGQMFEGRVSIQADGSWIVDQVGPPTN